jgi:hypothetical protein
VPPAASAAEGDLGYQDQSFSGATMPTADQPQSKLWYNDDRWWADMFDAASGDWHIFRLDRGPGTSQWVDTGGPTRSTPALPRRSTTSPASRSPFDKDTNGAVWATWTQVAGTGTAATGTVYLNSLTSGAAAWGAPCSWAGWERTPPPSG